MYRLEAKFDAKWLFVVIPNHYSVLDFVEDKESYIYFYNIIILALFCKVFNNIASESIDNCF